MLFVTLTSCLLSTTVTEQFNRSSTSFPNRFHAIEVTARHSTLKLLRSSIEAVKTRSAITPMVCGMEPFEEWASSITPAGGHTSMVPRISSMQAFSQWSSSMLPVGGLTSMTPRITAMTPIEKRLHAMVPIAGFDSFVARVYSMTPKVTGIAPRFSTSMAPLVDGIVPMNGAAVQNPPGSQQCFSRTARIRSLSN